MNIDWTTTDNQLPLDEQIARGNWRAKDRLRSSLVSIFPAALVGQIIKVILWDETLVTGRLKSCDGLMNLEFDGTVEIDRSYATNAGGPTFAKDYVILGRRIRHVLFPQSINPVKSLHDWDFDRQCTRRQSLEITQNRRRLFRRKTRADKYAYLRNKPSEPESDSSNKENIAPPSSSTNPIATVATVQSDVNVNIANVNDETFDLNFLWSDDDLA